MGDNKMSQTETKQDEKKTLVKKSNEITKFRTSLPSEMFDRSKVSIWSILKQCVGKELYRFTIPIIWNEPLSLLQRIAENIKYADYFLDRAAASTDPIERMNCLVGYLISSSSINVTRLSKPFNPLLGETYELVSPEKGYRVMCEQVSHHPPISAFYSESLRQTKSGPKWKYYGTLNPVMKVNFLNACVEAYPEGVQSIEFPELGETYTWHPPKIYAHNLIIGKLWFEYYGKVEIVNHKNNMRSVVEYTPYSWFSKSLNKVEGLIVTQDDKIVEVFGGKWDEYFYASRRMDKPSDLLKVVDKLHKDKDDKKKSSNENGKKSHKHDKHNDLEPIWLIEGQEPERIKCSPEYYNFTEFTMKLNDLIEEHKVPCTVPLDASISHNESDNSVTIGPIPPTDCRWRPDLRLYEKGELEAASNEKSRLEEKQREKRRQVEAGEAQEYKPLWFDLKPHHIHTDYDTWTFNNKYWKREYSQCPDLF